MKDFIDNVTDFTVKNLEIRNNTFNDINTDSGSKFEVEINYDEKSVSVEIIDCAIISNEQYQILLAAESERDELKSKISEPVDISMLMDCTIIDNVFDNLPQDDETMFFIDFGLGEPIRKPSLTVKNVAVIPKARYSELMAAESKLAELEAQEPIYQHRLIGTKAWFGCDLKDYLDYNSSSGFETRVLCEVLNPIATVKNLKDVESYAKAIDSHYPKPSQPIANNSEPVIAAYSYGEDNDGWYVGKNGNQDVWGLSEFNAEKVAYLLNSQVTPNKAEAPTDSGVVELDDLCKKYNDGEIDIVGLTSHIWNKAYWCGTNDNKAEVPILNPYEIDFICRVIKYPGCKLDGTTRTEDDGSEHGKFVADWKAPEQLGLVEAVGSYKWIPSKRVSLGLVIDGNHMPLPPLKGDE